MAKNLKLNIKNTQLAEALKLNQLKKPTGTKKKEATPKETTPKKESEASEEPSAAKQAPALETASTPPPVHEPTPELKPPAKESKAVESPPQKKEEEKHEKAAVENPPSAPSSQPQHRQSSHQPHYQRPHHQGHPSGHSHHSGSHSGGNRPPFRSSQGYPPRSSQPPYRSSSSSQPPYRPHSSSQPPYRSPSSTPPFRRENRPPGTTDRPQPYRPQQPRPYSPRPMAPSALPPSGKNEKPGARSQDTFSETKKPPGFKDYKDLKPQKKTDQRSFDVRDRQGLRDNDDEAWRKKRSSHKGRMSLQQEEIIRPKNLTIRIPISIKDLASEMKLKASQLISKLFMQGMVVTLNDLLDDETTIQLLGHEFDCEIKIDTREEERLRITEKTIKEEVLETPSELQILRPPVITFMGHVDHGKTSLIDTIRKSNIASGEAGAITQHIGAFRCHTAVGDICVLDTPGHEAFSAMRARGADVTDIVVLVVAGDEGLRTQTVEAIEQARTANVPIVVAINKSDKPNFNAENVYRQLADINLLPESWGGTIITVNCSAVTGQGIKELLEMLALQAEILELKANPTNRARGTVIESEMHKGLGAVATVLVQTGTLRIGDALVFAQHWARVKTMHDEHGKELSFAGPSTPIKITGLSGLPEAGSEFIAVKSEREARELSRDRTLGQQQQRMQQVKRTGLESLLQQKAESADKKTLNLILKADVQGSLEALKNSLLKIASNKIELNIIAAEVGEVSESDVQRAAASKATIIGFHTQVENHAESLIKQLKVSVKLHDIIYHAVDETRELMRSLLDKIPQETDTGTALVKAVFKSSQLGMIAGCQITDGTIKRNHLVRLLRDKEIVWKGSIASLKRVKEDVREVSKGYECGIILQNYSDIKEGDILQAYEITYLEQDL